MSATRKRWWGTLEDPEADNDPVTIAGHETLDALADNICRADCDLIRAQTNLVEAKEALEQAIGDRDRAHAAFIKRCSEKFSLEIPLPQSVKGDE